MLVSFDAGILPSRPLKVYLQNLFCSFLGVQIFYPLNSLGVQQILHASEYPRSYVQEAADILINSTRMCSPPNIGSLQEKVREFNLSNTLRHDRIYAPKRHSRLGRLWQDAYGATRKESKDIVVVLATSGYYSMFANFLCTVADLKFLNLLVLTSDEDIAALSKGMGLGVHMPGLDEGTLDRHADFGSLSYQQLMLFRTETVMDLLRLGFNVLVSDIDTVWLSDPLQAITDMSNRPDIVVTDDNGEVCGCFVYLVASERILRFWRQILQGHREIVRYSHVNNGGQLPEFHMSEQKLLTKFLYGNEYDGPIDVAILPKDLFPSGYQYFNEYSHFRNRSKPVPVIIHNNFLIGKEMKNKRFARYNLWKYSGNNRRSIFTTDESSAQCDYSPMGKWRILANVLYKATTIPTISIVLPIHDTVVPDGVQGRFLVQITTEGLMPGAGSTGQLYVQSAPPSYINFKTLAMYELQLNGKRDLSALTLVMGDSNLEISVDIALKVCL